MKWEATRARLKKANSSLADAFDYFYEQLEVDDRNKVGVSLQSYSFTERILDTGVPFWPGRSLVPDEYIVATGMPFGIILSHSCEVFEYTIPLASNLPRPTALLSAGKCIGVFELFDAVDKVSHHSQPDWNICAGSTSIRTTVNMNTGGVRDDLQKIYGSFDFDRFRNCSTLSQKANFIPAIASELQEWKVDLLFFNKYWFDILLDKESDTDRIGFAANRLKNILYAAAWPNLSRIRSTSTSFKPFFSPGLRSSADLPLVESSQAIAATTDDVIYGRMPVYVLDRQSDDVAPVSRLCEMLLEPFMKNPIVLRPSHISTDGPYSVGYLPLDYISPYIVSNKGKFGAANQSIRARILSRFEMIRNASDLVLAKRVDLPILVDLNKFFDHISFRVPSTQKASKGKDRASTFLRLVLHETADGTRTVVECDIAEEEFFQPYFDTLENSKCEFFRASVRIEAFRPEPCPPNR